MSESKDIPVLTDLIESGPEITLSDLGLADDPAVGANAAIADGDIAFDPADAAPITILPPGSGANDLQSGASGSGRGEISPALEQTVRRILDEHMELAWQEIRIAIQKHLERS